MRIRRTLTALATTTLFGLTLSAAPLTNWTFVEGGMGLDIGRAFVQFKTQVPVASNGDRRTPISVGFRF